MKKTFLFQEIGVLEVAGRGTFSELLYNVTWRMESS